jgi:hypothetical protein
MLAAAVATTACSLYVVTYRIFDIDLWYNLAYGRAILSLGRVPTHQMWTWPTWGQPDVNTSWLFRALVAGLWDGAGVRGLFAWRWISTLGTFGLAWLTARRLGARGFAPLAVLAASVLAYRLRAQIRPETLATLLLSATIAILEIRRQGGRDRSWWLVPIAWVWINAHLTYHLLFIVLGIHLFASGSSGDIGRLRDPSPARARLLLVALAALGVSFLNPFGWHALAWPFQYFLTWRGESFYRDIAELQPLSWHRGLALLLAAWPLLLALRARRRGVDAVEILMCLFLTGLVLNGQRFLGTYAVAACPYVARDLADSLHEWPEPGWLAGWLAAPARRAALTVAVCVGVAWLAARNPGFAPGIGIDRSQAPVDACEFIAKEGIRGRGFNDFPIGGYLLYRFWPDRNRLPFLGCLTEHSTRQQRQLYHDTFFGGAEAWAAIDREYRFDYALLMRHQTGTGELLDVLDADSSWALVFADDAAAIFVRRSGPLASVAARDGYTLLGAGSAKLRTTDQVTAADSTQRARLVEELRRQRSVSAATGQVSKMLGYIALLDGRRDEARNEFRRAISISPRIGRVHVRLGELALEDGRTKEALAEFLAELAIDPTAPGLASRIGRCYALLGDRNRAANWFRRARKLDPGNVEGRDSLGPRPGA